MPDQPAVQGEGEQEPQHEVAPADAQQEPVDPTEVLDPQTRQAVQAIVQGSVVESFSSPSPPPRVLDGYNQALPNGAERVVAVVEKQGEHRQTLERRGQMFGFIFAMTALVGGIVLIAIGQSAAGLVPLIGGLAGVGGLFFYSEHQAHKQNQLPPPPPGDND